MMDQASTKVLHLARLNALVTCGILSVDLTMVLFLTDASPAGLKWSIGDAARLMGLYLAASYLTPIVGGFVADRVLGARRTMFAGPLLAALGLFLLAYCSAYHPDGSLPVLAALSLVAAGYGLFRPTVIASTGVLARDHPAGSEAAQTIVWTGQNTGVGTAALGTGLLSVWLGWTACYTVAGAALVLGSLSVLASGTRLDVVLDKGPATIAAREPAKDWQWQLARFAVFFVLYIIAFNPIYISISAFIESRRATIFGYIVPTPWLLAIEPIAIVLLAPLAPGLWRRVERAGWLPSALIKSSVGFGLMGVAFVLLALAGNMPESLAIVILALVVVAASEFFQVPVGLGLLGQLVPARRLGLAVGLWYGMQSLASLAAGEIASNVVSLGYLRLFMIFSIGSAFAMILIWAIVLYRPAWGRLPVTD